MVHSFDKTHLTTTCVYELTSNNFFINSITFLSSTISIVTSVIPVSMNIWYLEISCYRQYRPSLLNMAFLVLMNTLCFKVDKTRMSRKVFCLICMI